MQTVIICMRINYYVLQLESAILREIERFRQTGIIVVVSVVIITIIIIIIIIIIITTILY